MIGIRNGEPYEFTELSEEMKEDIISECVSNGNVSRTIKNKMDVLNIVKRETIVIRDDLEEDDCFSINVLKEFINIREKSTPALARHIKIMLRQIFNFYQVTITKSMKRILKPKKRNRQQTTKEIHVFTDREWEIFEAEINRPWLKRAFRIQKDLGMRPGEVTSISLQDIDLTELSEQVDIPKWKHKNSKKSRKPDISFSLEEFKSQLFSHPAYDFTHKLPIIGEAPLFWRRRELSTHDQPRDIVFKSSMGEDDCVVIFNRSKYTISVNGNEVDLTNEREINEYNANIYKKYFMSLKRHELPCILPNGSVIFAMAKNSLTTEFKRLRSKIVQKYSDFNPKLSAHSIRKTAISEMLADGESIEYVCFKTHGVPYTPIIEDYINISSRSLRNLRRNAVELEEEQRRIQRVQICQVCKRENPGDALYCNCGRPLSQTLQYEQQQTRMAELQSELEQRKQMNNEMRQQINGFKVTLKGLMDILISKGLIDE